MARQRGRGRLSSIDLLPPECDQIITWAAQEFATRKRTLVEIYGEFKEKLIGLQGELGLGFTIPAFSSFHRHSIRQADMARRLEQTREIAATISERLDANDSDDLTLIAAEAIKTLIFELLQDAGEGGLSPKEAMELARALQSALAAQNVSTLRRQKVQAEFEAKTEKVIETVAKEAGLSAAAISQLRKDFLGVRAPEENKPAGKA